MKRQLTEWKNIFANPISDKEFVSKIFKLFLQLNSKKRELTQLKMGQVSV